MTKHCPDCKKDLPRDAFYKNRSRPDGLQAHCKPCYTAYRNSPARQAMAKAARRRYRASDLGKAADRRHHSALTKSGRGAIYQRIYMACKSGRLQRKRACTKCGRVGNTVFHHPFGYDGDNAWNIVELCDPCHVAEHHA